MEASVFMTNRSQAVRFASDVKKLSVRVVGNERIFEPINQSWDSFFLGSATISDDFMEEREIRHLA